jgi:hypothetical protein
MNDASLTELKSFLDRNIPQLASIDRLSVKGVFGAISTTRYSSRVGTSASLFDFRLQPCDLYLKQTMSCP